MNEASLRVYLEKLDSFLSSPAVCCIYGSTACMLLGEESRTSLDVDVAAPYSRLDETDFRAAAVSAGLPVNPPSDYQDDHIEWIGPLRLCLADPVAAGEIVLWKGALLTVVTASPADLVASKLIRYDPTDQADIQFLLTQAQLRFADIPPAVERLPAAFRGDPLVRENLDNLRRDTARWLR